MFLLMMIICVPGFYFITYGLNPKQLYFSAPLLYMNFMNSLKLLVDFPYNMDISRNVFFFFNPRSIQYDQLTHTS